MHGEYSGVARKRDMQTGEFFDHVLLTLLGGAVMAGALFGLFALLVLWDKRKKRGASASTQTPISGSKRRKPGKKRR